MSTQHDPIIQAAFEKAVRDFKHTIKNDKVYQQILATTCIDDVYNATDKIQEEQAKKGHLRHLTKIQPFLENLREYSSAIEVFLQAKPDILALIWGPIKLLLQWTSVLNQSFDAIVNTTRDVGTVLPEFKSMMRLFKDNSHIKDLLLLFFKDLLDFYAVAVNFFASDRWRLLFEALWPRHRDKIKVIMENIDRHTHLLRNEVRLEHIQQEHAARIRALEHYEVTEKAHRRQEFQAIRTNISPKSYGSTLDRLQGRVCPGTDMWLLQHETYVKWLGASIPLTNFLWLQGIPGAGKTYLSSLVVRDAESHGHTIYAFLTYTESKELTTLSVVHSLMFQLASDREDLQEIMCQSSSENLKSSLDSAVDLLVSLLTHAGLVYMIIDGLDEIDPFEIGRLVKVLLVVTEKCATSRILVSCRAEGSIGSVFKDKPTLRVDENNTESIEAFVVRRKSEWMSDSDFSPMDQTEIENLLAPLASNSKGMFLYARLILDNVLMLDDIDDVRNELRVLPETLDEAYGRILARINALNPPVLRDRIRKMLGYIGCSPVAITASEMEQALSITGPDSIHTSKFTSIQSVLRVCSSIVEVADECLQFVHFTVKEYLFNSGVTGHIPLKDSVLHLALCCTTYLQQSCYDTDRSDSQISADIVAGSYRLHHFVSANWYYFVSRYTSLIRSAEPDGELVRSLGNFMEQRLDIDMVEELSPPAPPMIEPYRSVSSYKHACLSHVAAFWRLRLEPNANEIDEALVESDPTTISTTSQRIHEQLTQILACSSRSHDACPCSEVRRHYGSRPHKCTFLNCPSRRNGFENRQLLDQHMKDHERPWKCDRPGCEYAKNGFLSRKMRDTHRTRCGQVEQSYATPKVFVDDIQVTFKVLQDLVKANEIEVLKDLMKINEVEVLNAFDLEASKYPGYRNFDPMYTLQVLAASASSNEMLVSLWNDSANHGNNQFRGLLGSAAKGGNIVNFRWIWSKQHPKTWFSNSQEFGWIIWESGDEEILAEWTRIIAEALDEGMLSSGDIKYVIFPTRPFRTLRELMSDVTADTLLKWWDMLHVRGLFPEIETLESTLKDYALDGQIGLTRYLLERGVNPNPRLETGTSWPLLPNLLDHSNAKHAEITRLLLYHGLDPNYRGRFGKIGNRDRKGAKNIHRYLGITWDELVEEARLHRASLEPELLWEWERNALKTPPSSTEVMDGPSASTDSSLAVVTSYWSAPERKQFPSLVQYFGTDFDAIADFMRTKSRIMVKNHYERAVPNGNHELANYATIADEKRARGEPMGSPPAPIKAPAR